MQTSGSQLWREVLGKLHELQDEVQRVEELVEGGLEAGTLSQEPPPSEAAELLRPSGPLAVEPPESRLAAAPGLVARLRRELDADPVQALDLSYPPGLFAPGRRPDWVEQVCLQRHGENTARLAMYVASRHGFRPSTVEVIGLCALLHDVGMERVPPELFLKSEPLAPDELRRLQAHAVEGAEMLRAGPRLDGLVRQVACAVVQQHHERADGSGYPHGLGEPHIHEFARLVALVEAYETMVSPRPYKSPCLPHEAMTRLLLEAFGKAGRPARFDRHLATSFLRALSLYPIGSGVRLDSGETAQVVGANPDAPARPHVRLLLGPDGRPVERPRVIDLRGAPVAVAAAVALPSWPPSRPVLDRQAVPDDTGPR